MYLTAKVEVDQFGIMFDNLWFSYLEISKALVAAELGSVRTEELLKPKVETFYKLTSEPNPVAE